METNPQQRKADLFNPPTIHWKIEYSGVPNWELAELYQNYLLEKEYILMEREHEEKQLMEEINAGGY